MSVAEVAARSHITDLGLAPEGARRIGWAREHMPVLGRLAASRLGDGALAGRRLAVVVHLEAKTACLVLALVDAGADVDRKSDTIDLTGMTGHLQLEAVLR